MNRVCKSIFVTLILTLALHPVFGEKVLYLNLDSKGNLLLSGDVNEFVRRHEMVSWIIQDRDIESFELKGVGPRNGNIFTTNPEGRVVTDRLDLKVAYFVRLLGGDWNYDIIYKRKGQTTSSFDPKIPVRPIVGNPFIPLLGFIITLLTTILYYNKWRGAAKGLKTNKLQKT